MLAYRDVGKGREQGRGSFARDLSEKAEEINAFRTGGGYPDQPPLQQFM